MAFGQLHRFERDGDHFVIDPETCFCFACDDITRSVLEHYPQKPSNAILHLLKEQHDPEEVEEVVSELEWLRATKAILPKPDAKAQLEAFQKTQSLKSVSVELENGGKAVVRGAAQLLMSRSKEGATLRLSIQFKEADRLHLAGELATEARKLATLSGKKLTVLLSQKKNSEAIPQLLSIEIDSSLDVQEVVDALPKQGLGQIKKLQKALAAFNSKAKLIAEVRPQVDTLLETVKALHAQAIPVIKVDFHGMVEAQGGSDPASAFQAYGELMDWYAARLKAHDYFRLDPIAGIFNQIYNGTPNLNGESAGSTTLHVNAQGDIFPSHAFAQDAQFKLGHILQGTFDASALQPFQDLGVQTTSACMKCWARGLCGGGPAAVHHARMSNIRTPDPTWCELQRGAMENAVVAFNILSASGVNFNRVYAALGKTAKLSLFQMAKAAMTLHLGLRPIEESDAALLTKWQNWSEAAYFTYNESGLMLATQYDREMDSLHPLGLFQEFVVIRRDGNPLGLLKFRPEKLPGTATLWIYLADASQYAEAKVRSSFKQILQEAGGQQELKQVMVPVGPKDVGLAEFLEAAGFVRAGVLREALYLHGTYHDITQYRLELN